LTIRASLAAAGMALAVDAAPASAYDDATLTKAENIARAQWPGSPCAGREQVDVTDALVNDREHAAGEAEVDSSCVVRIRRT
jgi:hypothetical protein